MKAGEVKNSTENQLLLADAWESSGENKNAIKLLTKLPPKQTLSRLARIYTSEQNWQKLVTLLDSQPKEPITTTNESLLLQLGYALHKLDKFEQSP